MQLIHFEHALPALAELGLEHLVPLFVGGGQVALDSDVVKKVLDSLSGASKTRAIRRLVMVSRASAQDLLAMEVDTKKESEALNAAALCSPEEAKAAVLGFFSQLGISLDVSPASSETGATETETPQDKKAGSSPSADS